MACVRGRGGTASCPRRRADDDCEKKKRSTAVAALFFHFRPGPRSLDAGRLQLGLGPAEPEATLPSGRCGGDGGEGLQPVELVGWLVLKIDDLLTVRHVLLALDSRFNKTSDRNHTRRVEESLTMRNCLLRQGPCQSQFRDFRQMFQPPVKC